MYKLLSLTMCRTLLFVDWPVECRTIKRKGPPLTKSGGAKIYFTTMMLKNSKIKSCNR